MSGIEVEVWDFRLNIHECYVLQLCLSILPQISMSVTNIIFISY